MPLKTNSGNCIPTWAEGRVDDPIDHEEARQEDRQYDEVHRQRVTQVEEAEEG